MNSSILLNSKLTLSRVKSILNKPFLWLFLRMFLTEEIKFGEMAVTNVYAYVFAAGEVESAYAWG